MHAKHNLPLICLAFLKHRPDPLVDTNAYIGHSASSMSNGGSSRIFINEKKRNLRFGL